MKNSTSKPDSETDWRSNAKDPRKIATKSLTVLSNTTRRQFIVNCSVVAVTTSIAPATLGGPYQRREVSLDQIAAEEFARQLNTLFGVRTERGLVKLILFDVRQPSISQNTSPSSEDARYEKFTLLFCGAAESPLAQDTYWFEHLRIGIFAMFIVPIGWMDERYCYYEAVFNRPPPQLRGRQFKSAFR